MVSYIHKDEVHTTDKEGEKMRNGCAEVVMLKEAYDFARDHGGKVYKC